MLLFYYASTAFSLACVLKSAKVPKELREANDWYDCTETNIASEGILCLCSQQDESSYCSQLEKIEAKCMIDSATTTTTTTTTPRTTTRPPPPPPPPTTRPPPPPPPPPPPTTTHSPPKTTTTSRPTPSTPKLRPATPSTTTTTSRPIFLQPDHDDYDDYSDYEDIDSSERIHIEHKSSTVHHRSNSTAVIIIDATSGQNDESPPHTGRIQQVKFFKKSSIHRINFFCCIPTYLPTYLPIISKK